MQIEEIITILKENPNFSLIWIPSSQKLEETLIYRLYNRYEQSQFVRGVVMIGKANNRLSNAEQRASATIIEKNVSAERFDKICDTLPRDLLGRIFC